MKKKIIIRGEEQRDRLRGTIDLIPEDHEVRIRPHKANRSLSQNSLHWKWLTVIAEEIGDTKDSVHEIIKRKHLVPILERDDPEYGEAIAAVRAIQGREREILARQVVRLTSTTKLNVEQMTEYLNEIEKTAGEMRISLPHPEDYAYAMEGKR
jgi:hypothetical protein